MVEKKISDELIISYSFPPSNTTTSLVMSKRILKNKKTVDVIQGSLNNLNNDDLLIRELLNEYIINNYIIELPFSDNWENIKEFVQKGMKKLNNEKTYEKIYSRAYFLHSHFLAICYKLKHPETYWTAEFSDPLTYNFERKNENNTPLTDKEYIDYINDQITGNIKLNDNINYICEYLTFLLADEIIFTNENQIEVMLFNFSDEIKNLVLKKAKIEAHPTLDEKYYHIVENDYKIDDNYINFAYFGVINRNRTLEDVTNAFDNLNSKIKDKFKLHIFTPNIIMFEQLLSSELLKKTTINQTIPFLEFLNLSTKFDVLIVNDSYTKDIFKINPYLPSKISDYIGSKKDIWAICDENSPMDKMNIKYKSKINDINSNTSILTKILEDKVNNIKVDENILSDEEIISYLQERSNHFIIRISELIQVLENEFQKNNDNSNNINNLKEEIEKLKRENNEIKNSNSWKITKNLRKIGKQFK
ncbi:hypothetical protein LJB96_00440 [Methanobrevibacter sp. OttesenSCG-928-K11]|nr:hypothetical protein [Methanobrevibacter sp. OttesenSCG-928-K11]MDL2270386.1 hypothetical protein [Methanobrevibacter sp. OttesenSCG-928-I08]